MTLPNKLKVLTIPKFLRYQTRMDIIYALERSALISAITDSPIVRKVFRITMDSRLVFCQNKPASGVRDE